MDFAGVPGNVAVTSNRAEFRLRHAFGEAQFENRYIIAAGQACSLMTPAKNQLSTWLSEYELSNAVDRRTRFHTLSSQVSWLRRAPL